MGVLYTREYSAKVIIPKEQLINFRDLQQDFYLAAQNNYSESSLKAILEDTPINGVIGLMIGAYNAPAAIAFAFITILNGMRPNEKKTRIDILNGGYSIVSAGERAYRNINFKAIEVEFVFIEDVMHDGTKVRAVQGGLGQGLEGCVVHRIQTVGGNWMIA